MRRAYQLLSEIHNQNSGLGDALEKSPTQTSELSRAYSAEEQMVENEISKMNISDDAVDYEHILPPKQTVTERSYAPLGSKGEDETIFDTYISSVSYN